MFRKIFILVFLSSCSVPSSQSPARVSSPSLKKEEAKLFSSEEIILSYELLRRIFDQEMAPITCVPDREEAGLLLRTLQPRINLVEDELEAVLDFPQETNKLISACEKTCTCFYLSDLLREHQVELESGIKKILQKKISAKEFSRCMNYAQTIFCEEDLYKTLDEEKIDFTFEDSP